MIKRVIFTSYDDFESKALYDDPKQLLVKEYFDRLIKNKQDYADKIGVDFVLFRNTMKDFDVPDQLDFTKANLYKHHLINKMADKYDEVMYVDMDIIFDTDLNVFEEHNLNDGIHIKTQDEDIISKVRNELLLKRSGLRSPTLKYHITKELLNGKDCHVINTGIVLAKSEHIKQIKFLERMPEAIDKINQIKAHPDPIQIDYYPNNESIFSYILEKYNIPYVDMDEEWHYVIDDKPKEMQENIHVMHFINKQFNTFFKDKTSAIFSIHIEIPDERLDNPKNYFGMEIPKSLMVKQQLLKYYDRLYKNHEEYAKSIGSTYLHFGRDDKYERFRSRFPDLSEYDVINLYKIYLLDELTKEYDHVMYVDMDVYFRRKTNVFNHLPLDYAICVQRQNYAQVGIVYGDAKEEYVARYDYDFRNPHAKYWNAHALLTEKGINGRDNYVYNTGVVLATRYGMDKLDYFSNIDEIIETMKDLQDEDFSMYPPQITRSFGYDNETIFSYKERLNNVPIYDLEDWWHYKMMSDSYKALHEGTRERAVAKSKYSYCCNEDNPAIIHFISKNFALAFGN